eukprot:CAMPEP_0206236620 /NCGR_PEP_ID=MMETSP0047_2-20121206/13816_1 /ASSEMBLY_ACC=CAM_ASM_000192 /TAXON_ID=195065 /ORGANISM="Chroomonas mesostigmatica_cf, Strain CCMP1168" /LENGTH=321 /DNA_ID=CAMNT_0053660975 /DNA_START=46 /DNA_END=1012 /DNA_ORIENTATION=+
MAPPKFGDLGKAGSSLLNDDFKYDGKCEVKTKLENGVAIKSTFTRNEKDGSIGAVLELKKKVSVLDVTARMDHKGAATLVAEHNTLIPNLNLKGEGALNGSSVKISADYKHDAIMTCASLDPIKSVIAVNSCVGVVKDVNVGCTTSYAYGKGKWTTPAISAQYQGPNYQLAANVENLGEKIGVTYHQTVNKEVNVAISIGQAGGDSKNLNMALGTSYKIDKDSSVKGKVDSAGILSALYVQKIRPQMTLKVSGQVNTTKLSADNAHKIGVALLMATRSVSSPSARGRNARARGDSVAGSGLSVCGGGGGRREQAFCRYLAG